MTEPTTLPSWDSFGGEAVSALENPEQAVAATQALLADARTTSRPTPTPPWSRNVDLERGILRDGVWYRNAEVRELTGEDEEAIAAVGTDDFRVFEAILVRGVVAIGPEPMTRALAGELLMGDRELLVLGVRKATFGEHLEFERLPCPVCTELTDLKVHLDQIPLRHLEQPDQVEHPVPLKNGATAYVALPTGADQAHVNSLKDATEAQQNTAILNRCIRRIAWGDGTEEQGTAVARRLSIPDRRTLIDYLIKTQPGPRYADLTWVHETCGEEVPLPVSLAILFRGM